MLRIIKNSKPKFKKITEHPNGQANWLLVISDRHIQLYISSVHFTFLFLLFKISYKK